MKLEWSPSARARAAFIDAYWREERTKAPDRFTEELIAAIQHILDFPEVPAICAHVRGQPLRRVLLKRSHQYVYYLVRRDDGIVRIHAIRGTRRRPTKMDRN